MRRLHLLILLLFVVSKAMGVNPKGFYLDNLGNATELLSVKCIGQDEDGLIWFGTDKGLYHFNGYSVKSYLGRISNIQTRCILALNGSVLLGYNGGLLSFDRIEEQFRQVEYFRNDIVNTITRSGDILYIGTDSGLYQVEYKDLHTPGAIAKLYSGSVRTMLCPNQPSQSLSPWAPSPRGSAPQFPALQFPAPQFPASPVRNGNAALPSDTSSGQSRS